VHPEPTAAPGFRTRPRSRAPSPLPAFPHQEERCGSFRRDPSPSLLPAGSRMKEALDADHFEDLPGKFQAGILEAEQKRPKLRVVESS
jgi:hypothetical protein